MGRSKRIKSFEGITLPPLRRNAPKMAKKWLKTKYMDYDMMFGNDLFKETADLEARKLKRCRTCRHRKRFSLNEYSTKVVQCCELQPSKRSNSGLKTIKVTDVACRHYEKR